MGNVKSYELGGKSFSTGIGQHSHMPRKGLRLREWVYEALIRLVTLKLHSQKVTELLFSKNNRTNARKGAGRLIQSYKVYKPRYRLGDITARLHGVCYLM